MGMKCGYFINPLLQESLQSLMEALTKFYMATQDQTLTGFRDFEFSEGWHLAFLYLHEEWEQVVLHRDIKPGNVLLDANLNAKLGDFGLAKLCDHGSNPQTTNLVGTIGYLAPEFLRTGKATASTDVFAFGAFMLEVACGRRPIEPGMVDLAEWVVDCWKRGAIIDVNDPRLEGIYVEEQMELVLKLGLFCSHSNPETRPSMKQVMTYLDGGAILPNIPPDSIVLDVFRARNDPADINMSFHSLVGSISSCTTCSVDSILTTGR